MGYVGAINKTTSCLYCRDHEDFTAPHAALTEPRGRINALPERRFAGPELAICMTSYHTNKNRYSNQEGRD